MIQLTLRDVKKAKKIPDNGNFQKIFGLPKVVISVVVCYHNILACGARPSLPLTKMLVLHFRSKAKPE